ncbi:uncharacterized protein [Drosophila tropicalis]|uniref:uncharacterized protein n=1 Tax=Drosophila tropicalis TaxID=46794 RepID=UPI0035AB92BA
MTVYQINLPLLSILIVSLLANIYDLCVGFTSEERHLKCFQSRMMGQRNCSPCIDLYIFNRDVGYRRCEHVNGRCFPFRTVFKSARQCEDTCRPFLERNTLGKQITVAPKLPPLNQSDEDYDL